jgi:hypothetical protein
MDEYVLTVFVGNMVDYMVATNSEKYPKCVYTGKNGTKYLYVRLVKALYGCLKSALLWWELLSITLKEDGFVLNPYNHCVANKIMPDGNKQTICWYVDNLKISHMRKEYVETTVDMIDTKFGKTIVTRGTKHVYLGINIKSKDKTVELDMREQVQEAIDLIKEDCSKAVPTPASSTVFDINENSERLPEQKRKILHSTTAKLLYIPKNVRPDVLLPVSFLTSRITKATKQDWSKLKRVLQYLQSAVNLTLTLSMDDLCVVKTWVDTSFAVHGDMKSHTGGIISLGRGAVYASSKNQKLNTKSSTETELVGAGDFLPQTLWTANFLQAQGYSVQKCKFFQNKTSVMKLETNGRKSSSAQTRHINIRYFFIKDRIKSGDIILLYCQTGEMVPDFQIKPQQGKQFQDFHDEIMGKKHESYLVTVNDEIQECVGNNDLNSLTERETGREIQAFWGRHCTD